MAGEERAEWNAEMANTPELFDHFSAYEDELILDFLQHRLSDADRRRFEEYYLPVMGGGVRVAAVRERLAGIPRVSENQRRGVVLPAIPAKQGRTGHKWLWPGALAALLLAALFFGIFRGGKTVQESAETAALLLMPSAQRGPAGAQNLVPAPDSGPGRFRFVEAVEPGPGALTATLRRLDGEAEFTVAVSGKSTAEGWEYLVTVPPGDLTPADYILTVRVAGAGGPEITASRYFRVRGSATK